MADKNLNQVDGGQTTSPASGRLYIIKPAATPSGFQDHWITEADLHLALQNQITINTDDITALDVRVTAVEASSLKTVTLSSITTSFAMPAYSMLDLIVVNWKSATPEIRVGTTEGGDEIQSDIILTSEENIFSIILFQPYWESTDIYITVSDGVIDFTRFTRTNIFTS